LAVLDPTGHAFGDPVAQHQRAHLGSSIHGLARAAHEPVVGRGRDHHEREGVVERLEAPAHHAASSAAIA